MEQIKKRRKILAVSPRIVCLCGSTQFLEAFQQANVQETFAGRIVLTIGCDTKSDAMRDLSSDVKEMLDELHKCKIDLADEVLILNVGGYVGASTQGEIAYAYEHDKHVRWWEGCVCCGRIDGCVTCDLCGVECCCKHRRAIIPEYFGKDFQGRKSALVLCSPCYCL